MNAELVLFRGAAGTFEGINEVGVKVLAEMLKLAALVLRPVL